MNKNIEKEYKVLLTKEQFEKLLSNYPNAVFKTQCNTYYDTDTHCIQKKKGAMRIRQINDKFIFTLKMHSNDGLLEFEKEVNENSLNSFQDVEIQNLLDKFHINGNLIELTTLCTQRATIETEFAEICFDISSYNGCTDYEIEYEYKKEHDGLSIFQDILKDVHITYTSNCKSKIQRALESF